MNVMMIPLPQSFVRQLRDAVATPEQVEEAKIALRLTNGNIPRAGGILRHTMSLPTMCAALRAAAAK